MCFYINIRRSIPLIANTVIGDNLDDKKMANAAFVQSLLSEP